MRRRLRRLAAALCMAVLLVAAGCSKASPRGKAFYLPLSAEPRQLDPQVSTDAASVTVVAALFEGLTRLDEDGAAVPGAAEWTVSGDGLTYTFTLRDSMWSDGTAVTAQDFVFGMQRSVLPTTRSTLASQLFCIRGAREISEGKQGAETLGVTAPDSRTVVITLTEPDAAFPEKAAATPFMPCNRAFFESTDGRYGLEQEFVLTNGPFSLKRWSHSRSLTLVKNEGYHNSEDIYPASVQYVIKDLTDPLATLEQEGLDAAQIPAGQAEAAKSKGLQTVMLEDTIRTIWLNNKVTVLSSAPVRRALRSGIEWPLVNEQLDDAYCAPAAGYVAPDAVVAGAEPYRTKDNACMPSADPAGAQQALADGLAALELTACPKLTVLCADDDYSRRLALYVMQSWQKNLFLYFDIAYLPADELSARVSVGNYEIAIVSSTVRGMTALDAFAGYVTDASGNQARFSSSAYDMLYASAASGTVTRGELSALEAMLVQECPSIPLCFESRVYGISAKVSGLIVRPFGGGAFGAAFDFRHAGKTEK